VRIDSDVLAWLRAQGKGYQSRINAILRVRCGSLNSESVAHVIDIDALTESRTDRSQSRVVTRTALLAQGGCARTMPRVPATGYVPSGWPAAGNRYDLALQQEDVSIRHRRWTPLGSALADNISRIGNGGFSSAIIPERGRKSDLEQSSNRGAP